jgi:hypothetical protein
MGWRMAKLQGEFDPVVAPGFPSPAPEWGLSVAARSAGAWVAARVQLAAGISLRMAISSSLVM